ncbi:MAG: helix-turn-helix domain-containing protein, partial [Desulfohalobiaceae bacterium]
MPQHHSLQIRETALKKALTGLESTRQIADQMGVGLSTLQRWLREARNSGEPVMPKQEKRPQDWSR